MPTKPRFALYMQDKHPLAYELEMAEYAESRGFSEIWQADTRLARDCVVMMSAFLTRTKRLRVGSGVLPIWTRNAAVIAATWSTMWELGKQVSGDPDAPSRVMLGLGAWWEPIASRVGVNRTKPLKAMREYVEACRQLFTMEEVTYEGEFVRLDRVKLDVVFGERPAGYLDDLGRRLDPRVGVYWTGEEICTREFSVGHLARVADALRRRPTLWDNYPVSPGHALLVPRRHVPTWFDAAPEEQQELTAAIEIARAAILARHRPDGFNVGMNLGAAAGQTVGHLHLHVIPRYAGDVPDPRGGVRWVVPQRADYWSKR